MMADTWDSHSRKDVAERAVLAVRSRTDRRHFQDVEGHARGAILMVVWWLILEKPPYAIHEGFSTEFGLKTRRWWFQRESEAAHGVITDGASR